MQKVEEKDLSKVKKQLVKASTSATCLELTTSIIKSVIERLQIDDEETRAVLTRELDILEANTQIIKEASEEGKSILSQVKENEGEV